MSEIEFRHDRTQIIVPVAILHPDPTMTRLVRTDGLLDTGASLCGISAETIAGLGLPRAGKLTIQTPAGLHVARSYRLRVGFYPDETSAMPIVMAREFIAIESQAGDRFGTLIGMNILGSGDLRITRGGTGSFGFEVD